MEASYANRLLQELGKVNTGKLIIVDNQFDRTVGENIDARIAQMKAEIARLEESKASLAPLLQMKISDIRSAMNY